LKILTIGPFPPLRGGISDFHYSLFNEFSKHHDISVLSFKKLYPSILFPGKNQYHDKHVDVDSVYNILNPINIFSWFRAKKIINNINPDRIIISYWHFFFIPLYIYILKNAKNVKRYVLFHNVLSHQRKSYEIYLLRLFLKYIDCCVVMNDSAKKQINEIDNNKKIIKTFHPLYVLDNNAHTKESARKELGIVDSKVILFFGLIRPYKGLDNLIKAVKHLNGSLSDFKVVIAGENYESMSKYYNLINKLNLEEKFMFDLKFIDEDNTAKYFIASDIVVMPYKHGSQSGVLSLAYNFNRPVIVTNVGGLSEYIVNGKTGFVVSDEKELSNKIGHFFKENMFEEMTYFIRDYKKQFSWKEFERKVNE